MRSKLNGLKIAQQIAKERDGKCLSTKYINNKTKMRWKCRNSHEWEANLSNAKYRNTWCSECVRVKKLDGLTIAREIAESKDGKCLSIEYINANKKMKWECWRKHRWEVSLNHIKNGKTWCPKCAGVMKLDGLPIAHKIAKSKNGKCLSTEYINSNTNMHWICNKNHEWYATLTNIRANTWCNICSYPLVSEKLKIDGLKIAQEISATKGGKCLSTKYIGISKRLLWECKKKHKWKTSLGHIKNNTWCPECYGNKQLDGLNIANELAIAKDGKCLSIEYTNTDKKMHWECGKGHQWYACLYSIKNLKTWCPECGYLQAAKNQNNSHILFHWKTKEELICTASYEKAVVEYLNVNRINFRWQPKTFITNILTPTGKLSTYRPDLYLYSTKKWIEIKGYFREKNRIKWEWFQTIKPNSELWDQEKLKEMKIL